MMTMVMVMISNPQTALGNHMESLGRTLLEKVAEVGEQCVTDVANVFGEKWVGGVAKVVGGK